jgi:hypothetical protein
MSTELFLTIVLWAIRVFAIAFFGAQIVLIGMVVWVGIFGKRKEARILANMDCPHCGIKFGRDAARSATCNKNASSPKSESPRRGYYVPETVVVCPRCQGSSFWYPMTYRLSPESDHVLGIIESRRSIAKV